MNLENLLTKILPTRKLSLRFPILDKGLGGGIACQSITELVGESGVGKTQFCLQLSLIARLPISYGGLLGSSIYVNTEFAFSLRRLNQLATNFKHNEFDFVVVNQCDDIYVTECENATQLLRVLDNVDPFIRSSRSRSPVKLIVIDSFAPLFRSQYNCTPFDMTARSSLFFKISGRLKELAFRFGLAVVITNQVVDYIESPNSVNGVRIGNVSTLISAARRVCHALSLSWANCVNTRVFLSICYHGASASMVDKARLLQIVFAPHLPPSSCSYVIKREWVFGVGVG